MSSGIDVVNATDEAFSFVDESQTYSEVASNIEVEPEEETTSEFEGLGSMFD